MLNDQRRILLSAFLVNGVEKRTKKKKKKPEDEQIRNPNYRYLHFNRIWLYVHNHITN